MLFFRYHAQRALMHNVVFINEKITCREREVRKNI